MKMTKKHFKAIAEAISESDTEMYDETPVVVKKSLIWSLGNAFKDENPEFDIEKFEEACYE